MLSESIKMECECGASEKDPLDVPMVSYLPQDPGGPSSPKNSETWMQKYELNSDLTPTEYLHNADPTSTWDYVLWRMRDCYQPDNIFCAKDFPLTLVPRGDRPAEDKLISVNVLMCTNITGSMKLPITIIGNVDDKIMIDYKHKLDYVYNESSQLTSNIVRKWLDDFHNRLLSQKRNSLLVVNISPPFLYASSTKFTHLEIIFFPSENSSTLQPMDHIAEKMKYLNKIYYTPSRGNRFRCFVRNIARNWDEDIARCFIQDCFDKAGFFLDRIKWSPLQASQMTRNRELPGQISHQNTENTEVSTCLQPMQMQNVNDGQIVYTELGNSAQENGPTPIVTTSEQYLMFPAGTFYEKPVIVPIIKNEVSPLEPADIEEKRKDSEKVLSAFQIIEEAFQDPRISPEVRQSLDYCRITYEQLL